MDGAKSGIQGGTPEMKVQPVDPNLPECGAQYSCNTVDVTCTRKKGHYGQHGDGTLSWPKEATNG